ncbi:MAG: hypothetical protein COU90_04555 [Candidatus Ryanbacteria bacterium CG10_big_fil_rev_8_21_14_0_10_43_42]|uniref:Uncharacterized protein n=1 Tax=Candidatus Ryanbacteria bacterium CG10_big_fil_rev_8_21_14_0_10_43_42 TaxID=1974864 RepID=A0A2M8KW61_9BACT|nr:MAG: hypothetical protein COU90_04555 [Candidatus Ryanbacteria bacterium CG10_big_fil_rev_8_21_14_0_10_43_42]
MKTRTIKFSITHLPIWNIVPFLLFAAAVVLAGVYIYGINQVVVDSLFVERANEQMAVLEEEIRELEGDLAQLSVGYRLEEEASQLGLTSEGPVYFLEKNNAVARADN